MPNHIKLKDLPFHTRAYACLHLITGVRQPRLVVHHADGDIGVLCGQLDHPDPSLYRWIGIGHLLEQYAMLRGVPEIKSGYEAELIAIGWVVRPDDENE